MEQTFGKLIDDRLSEMKLSKYEMARRAGIPIQSIYNVLKHGKPNSRTMIDIVNALDGEVIIKFGDEEFIL